MTASGVDTAPPAESLTYVGFWRRVVANVIDSFLFFFITFPVLAAVRQPDDWTAYWMNPRFGLLEVLINWVWPMIVTLYFWKEKQATPGKMVVKARIVDASTGDVPSTSQLVIRYVIWVLGSIPLGLGSLSVGWDERKQGWHDKAARTVVVGPDRWALKREPLISGG